MRDTQFIHAGLLCEIRPAPSHSRPAFNGYVKLPALAVAALDCGECT